MNDIVLALIAAISGGGIAGLLTVIQRRRLTISQSNKLDAEASRIALQTITDAMEKLRSDYCLLSEEANTLKNEIERLKRELNKMQKAIEKIGNCEYRNNCPVSVELNSKKNQIK